MNKTQISSEIFMKKNPAINTIIKILCLMFFVLFGNIALADKTQLKEVTLEDLGWMDKNKMQQQEDKIKAIASSKLGMSLNRNWKDIQVLQRMIDQKLVETNDFATQEAMGVILGYVMQADFPSHLEWKIYKDKLGRSKALCVKKTQECLFPVTMLSRRLQLEMQPNVTQVYDNAIDQIAFSLPKMPYGDELLHQLKR